MMNSFGFLYVITAFLNREDNVELLLPKFPPNEQNWKTFGETRSRLRIDSKVFDISSEELVTYSACNILSAQDVGT